MPLTAPHFVLIEDQRALEKFYHENKSVSWLSFDSEFVGEKRFYTLLCLIQVATENGYYLIDPLQLDDLSLFLDLIENPNIVKVTHAGDNDYRLLNIIFGTIPKNIFDTQVAAGLLGYKHPVSFRKLVENELRIYLDKGYTVADWESRPFKEKQLKYALNDVLPLFDLWKSLAEKLEKRDRHDWGEEEFARWEFPDYYIRDPNKEAVNSNLIKSLKPVEQVFLIRLFDWRRKLAEQKNYSREMVLPGKLIGQIVKSIHSGKDALRHNRRIPHKIEREYGSLFERLYQQPATEMEKQLLQRLPVNGYENPKEEILLDMLYLLVKHKCLEKGISPNMVFPKAFLKKVRTGNKTLHQVLIKGWRAEVLGEEIVGWILNFSQLVLNIQQGKIELKLK